MKERYAVTDLQSQQNKMSFSAVDGEYGDSAMGVDKGMVGSKDSGRLRAPQKKESKVGLSKKQKIAVVSFFSYLFIFLFIYYLLFIYWFIYSLHSLSSKFLYSIIIFCRQV